MNWRIVNAVVTIAILVFGGIGIVHYWQSFDDVPEQDQSWAIPPASTPAGQAYLYAHSIQLPSSIPGTTPFKFCEKKLFNDCGVLETRRAYYEHLCKTEAGRFILRTVERVEGVQQIRPRVDTGDAALHRRYRLEDPAMEMLTNLKVNAGMGPYELASAFIQPPSGKYEFYDGWFWDGRTLGLNHYYREADAHTSDRQPVDGYPVSLSWGINYIPIDKSSARYAFVTRGIRRERDREFGIAGTELIIMDLEKNEVLAVLRDFDLGYADGSQPDGINWGAGRRCFPLREYEPLAFIKSVLVPIHEEKK